MQKFFFILVVWFLPCCVVAQRTTDTLHIQQLLNAYPATLQKAEKNIVYFNNGTALIYDAGKAFTLYNSLLDSASLRDQMRGAVYPAGRMYDKTIPFRYDSSRIRSTAFFEAMYGRTQAEIEKNLTTVKFFGKKIQINKINGVAAQLRQVEKELRQLPDSLHKYCTNAVGGYAYRVIAGTDRKSMHSFGIAIDLNLQYTHYWQWEKTNTQGFREYKNRIPIDIVEIFEKYGFVWGGKWWHFDTMHFEYRPELLPQSKILNRK
jgi:peptidoglycan LD-endopeptidase CwlK